jgi:F-type H+-transporting ATPase subunit delta
MASMTSHGAAVRYARALFETTLAEHRDVAAAFGELEQFAALLRANASLERVLTNPAIPVQRRRAVVDALLARAGTLQPAVAKLLQLLADRDRLGILGDVSRAFESQLMDHQNVVRAELVTALALSDDRVQAIKTGLKTATGRDVQLDTRVDPAILGGAVARIGSTVYDGSIARRLERMRETLTSTAD